MLNAALFGAIAAGQSDAPPAATLPEDEPLPTPLNTVAGTTSNFDSLLGSSGTASPGTRITLANGSYGTKTIAVSGTSANPIQVVATTQFGPVFTGLIFTGNHIIMSGVTANRGTSSETGHCVQFTGSNIRFTRGRVTNGGRGFLWNSDATDTLVDHCEVSRTRIGMFDLNGPIRQRRLTVARCWCHTPLPSSDTAVTTSHYFQLAGLNTEREVAVDTIARFNYLGPGSASGKVTDFNHHKVSTSCWAFNRFDGTSLITHRFGLRGRYIGNYGPNAPLRAYDSYQWIYGNRFSNTQCTGGVGRWVDDTKNSWCSMFHAFKKGRLAGNNSPISLGWGQGGGGGGDFCNAHRDSEQGTVVPADPQACGGVKPAGTLDGITYAADVVDADTGVKIRAHTGAISEFPMTGCIDWVQNLDSEPGAAAPSAWRTELFAEYPWIEAICSDPTSQTGGPGGTHPLSIAQALTRGDAATPNTGPFRDSPGGRP